MRSAARAVGGRHHAALTGGEVLGRVETEAGEVADGAHLAAGVDALHAVRGVFDQHDPARTRNRLERLHAARDVPRSAPG